MEFTSFIAIGDSFTEGLGDLDERGTERGWADLLARCLAERLPDPSEFSYANLAIRGRKMGPLIEEQLPPALDQGPELLSICGGGNDAMRPSVHLDELSEMMRQAVIAARERGAFVLALSGADPTEHLPLGSVMRSRAAALTHACEEWARDMDGVAFCNNFDDERLRDVTYWSPDGLHLNTRGHACIAENTLRALSLEPPQWLLDLQHDPDAQSKPLEYFRSGTYYRRFVMPWVKRRLTGRSSGDGRAPKRPDLKPVV